MAATLRRGRRPVLDECDRRGAGERAELAVEVRLVGVAAGVRGRGGPAPPRRSASARRKRRIRPTVFGGTPTCSRKRAARCRRLHPSSPASAPIRTLPPVACSRDQARSRSGGGAGAPARPAQRAARRAGRSAPPSPGAASSRSSSSAASRPSSAPRSTASAPLQLVERHARAARGPRTACRSTWTPRAVASKPVERGPVVDGGDEGAEPLARDLERRAEVDDQAHAVLRQLGADDGRGGALLVARVPQDGAAEQRMRARARARRTSSRRGSPRARSRGPSASPPPSPRPHRERRGA